MAFYAVDVRDQVIQRVTRQYDGVDNKRFFLIEAGSAKQAWAKASRASAKRSAAPIAMAVPIVIVALVKNAPSQNDTRTIGFVTVAGS